MTWVENSFCGVSQQYDWVCLSIFGRGNDMGSLNMSQLNQNMIDVQEEVMQA
jgi:hypothetical protein